MANDLDLSGRQMHSEGLAAALLVAEPGSISTLSLAGNPDVADTVAEALVATDHLLQLQDLDLSGLPMTDTALADLLRAVEASALTALRLGCWPTWRYGEDFPDTPHPAVGPETLAVLADPTALPHLSTLVLHTDWLDDTAFAAWVQSPGFGRLRALSITAMLSAASLTTLLANVAGIEDLVLNVYNLASDDVLRALAAAMQAAGETGAAQRLVCLASASDSGLVELLDAALPHLETLELPRVALGPAGLARLQTGPYPPRLGRVVLHRQSAFPTGDTIEYADQGTVIDSVAAMAPLAAVLLDLGKGLPIPVDIAPERAWPSRRPLRR